MTSPFRAAACPRSPSPRGPTLTPALSKISASVRPWAAVLALASTPAPILALIRAAPALPKSRLNRSLPLWNSHDANLDSLSLK